MSAVRRVRRWLLGAVIVVALTPTLVIGLYAVADPPLTPLMLIRAAQGHPIVRHWRPLDGIAPTLHAAVIAAEDSRFCRHSGFDREALQREIGVWLDGERPRGASTITMQTAKNILLWPGRDPARKAIEAWMTPQIEMLWSKRRILEVYLNVVEFAPGIYGAEAAARQAFGRPARDLSRRQAALLAAVLPNPLQRSAAAPSPLLLRRAERIDRYAGQLGPLLDCLRMA
ncbi:MAG: monofunctional biosynthetic peptidoglycan transglycosylase [Rhodospirillales bacterium]|jgi:monofunctional biosynthetic peptidoglycan transglycosylase|nr:monofunctional biosynthetic peptidoglycan transglycosylase [Rhodospirillales bacterium]